MHFFSLLFHLSFRNWFNLYVWYFLLLSIWGEGSIKGKEKRKKSTAPPPYPPPPKHHPYAQSPPPCFSFKCSVFIKLFLIETTTTTTAISSTTTRRTEWAACPLHKHQLLSSLRFFHAAGDKSFRKVESCPKRDHTQPLSIQLLGAGRHTLTHSHKMAALTKIPSTHESCSWT